MVSTDLENWLPPPETHAELDWAPLLTLDLSRFDKPGGKESLAAELRDASTSWGFWTVINSGIPQALVDRHFAIANMFFNQSTDEKKKVIADYEGGGSHFGYRVPRVMEVGDEHGEKHKMLQNVEGLNIPKIPSLDQEMTEPLHDVIKKYRSDIAEFQKLCYEKVLRRLLVLIAIILELPEDYFVERHDFCAPSEDHVRMLKYHPRSEEEDKKMKDTWLRGHTDFGSLTLLFSQPVAALQILAPSNEWKWVKPVEGGITCNAADVMSLLTKGYIKSSVHRVVRPPPDQAHLPRISLIYFLRPGNDVPMIPAPSPVLLRKGLIGKEEVNEEEIVTGYEYVRARAGYFNTRKTLKVGQKGQAEKPVHKVKHLTVQDYYV
ncbi:hypothetical protein E1B28_013620 [Marasmius oreades]|uniref:Fe2OG dioxygenase domain-containing protein n=1 Tax=Marasmius oreades TaxID=181124 RepID=A0A9P7RQ66_9AGAR|nr:uncharacterized protein E1B28_013620 [Marasmius oreades]KAG7087672.1 hypothetical protein E1B28_013620 [Marasmius oreades]